MWSVVRFWNNLPWLVSEGLISTENAYSSYIHNWLTLNECHTHIFCLPSKIPDIFYAFISSCHFINRKCNSSSFVIIIIIVNVFFKSYYISSPSSMQCHHAVIVVLFQCRKMRYNCNKNKSSSWGVQFLETRISRVWWLVLHDYWDKKAFFMSPTFGSHLVL